MTEILALLQTIAPLLGKTTLRQLSQAVFGILVASGKITILLALVFLLIIEKYKTLWAYPFVLFQMFFRGLALVVGEFGQQDEAITSAILGLGT